MATDLLTDPSIETSLDPRLKAFQSPTRREVFHSVCHAEEICTPDQFDVRSIHAEARDTFESMIARATTPPGLSSGRSLLLLGESGSGKTHLLRAFRSYVHSEGLGYCGYLQMTSPTNNYDRYILSNLLDSLDKPYLDPQIPLSGLMCLSNALVDCLGPDYHSIIEGLHDAPFDSDELGEEVYRLAGDIVGELKIGGQRTPSGSALDVVRSLLYLQREDVSVRAAVHQFLRCSDLDRHARRSLGDIVPWTDGARPMEMIATLGQLMLSAHRRPLVLFVDQLEEMYNLDNAELLFRRAMAALNSVAEHVPSSSIVIACLEDYYERLKPSLARSLVDKLEGDPDKLRLDGQRSEKEILDLVACRLAVLYDEADVDVAPDDPTYPIPVTELRKLRNTRTRDVLDYCRRFQNGAIVIDPPPPPPPGMEQAWQAFLAEGNWNVPVAEDQLALTLSSTITHLSDELVEGGYSFESSVDGRYIAVETHAPDNSVQKTLIGICNKRAQGGGLSRQVTELQSKAAEHGRVIVRSLEFPSSPSAKISTQIGDFIARGGRRAVIEDALWRTMLAFEDFRRKHGNDAGFSAWRKSGQPLTRLQPLRELLQINRLGKTPVIVEQPQKPAVTPRPTLTPVSPVVEVSGASVTDPTGPLQIGWGQGFSATDVTINVDELTRHAAFLGGSGSGKTTVALNLIEQLLERGIPAVLIDRKGDLCSYADPNWWNATPEDAAVSARKRALRQKTEVALYTPGNARGRPIGLAVVPAGISAVKEFDQLANSAMAAMASMIGFDSESRHGPQRAILLHAIRQLALLRPDKDSGIEQLVELIDSADSRLVNAIGKLDNKHFKKIVQGLETLRLTRGELLSSTAERLDFDRWLSPSASGKTKLNILSTKFLGETIDVQFWMTQFLNELRRWTSKHPAKTLQAVFLFDEADVYLPARTQPPTKAPMEDLLKRARSAGIGLFLATQSPGDLDYKCRENIRSWFIGRVKEDTAIAKLRPMLEAAKFDVAAKLPAQGQGEFQFVRDAEVMSLKSQRSLMSTEQLSEEMILRLAGHK
jgi:energy-coupling factor transporter ATP-binding protein EcfA2